MTDSLNHKVDSQIASTLAEIARLLESEERADARIVRVLELVRDIVPFDFCALLTGSSKDSPLLTVPEINESRRIALRSWLLGVMHLMEGKSDSRKSSTDPSRVMLPVIGGDRLIGILHVESSKSYGIYQVQLLSVVASQLGAYLAMVGLVSACRQAEETLRQQEERLRKTEKLAVAGRVAASLAHEINNPLAAVTNVLYLLENQSALDQAALDLVKTGAAELARVSRIVKQSLSYYRAGQNPHDLDFGVLVNESLGILGERFQRAGIELRKEIETDTLFLGFPDEIRQVVDNLLLNCLEATPHGGSVRILVRKSFDWAHPRRRGVRLTIADSGSGISKQNRPRVFDPFFTTKGEKGTGLGLWVLRSITAKHEGSIRLRSSDVRGKSGTIVSVFWPSLSGVLDSNQRGELTIEKTG